MFCSWASKRPFYSISQGREANQRYSECMNAQPQHSEQPKSQHFCLSNADKGVSETKIHRDHFQKQINFVKQFQKEITSVCPHLDQAHTFPKTHLAGDCGVVNELKEMEALSLL